MKLSFTALATFLTLAIPSMAYAHPGHGRQGSNALHLLVDHPIGALIILASLCVVAWRKSPTS